MTRLRFALVLCAAVVLAAPASAQRGGLFRALGGALRGARPVPAPRIPTAPSLGRNFVPSTSFKPPPSFGAGRGSRPPTFVVLAEHSPARTSEELGKVTTAGAKSDWAMMRASADAALARPGLLPPHVASDLAAIRANGEVVEALKGVGKALEAGTPARSIPLPDAIPPQIRVQVQSVCHLEELTAALQSPGTKFDVGRLEAGLKVLAADVGNAGAANVRIGLARRVLADGDLATARRLIEPVPDDVLPLKLRDLKRADPIAVGPGAGKQQPTGPEAAAPEAGPGARATPEEAVTAGLPVLKESVARARASAVRATDEAITSNLGELNPVLTRLAAHGAKLAEQAREEDRIDAEEADRRAAVLGIHRFDNSRAAGIAARSGKVEDKDVASWGWWAIGLAVLLAVYVALETDSGNPFPFASAGAIVLVGLVLFWWSTRFSSEQLLVWAAFWLAIAIGGWGAWTARSRPRASAPRAPAPGPVGVPILDSTGVVTAFRLPPGQSPQAALRSVPSYRARRVLGGVTTVLALGFLIAVFPGWRERTAFHDLRDHALMLARGHNPGAALARADQLVTDYPDRPEAPAARTQVRLAAAEDALERRGYSDLAAVLATLERDDPWNERVSEIRQRAIEQLTADTTNGGEPAVLESALRLAEQLLRSNPADPAAVGLHTRLVSTKESQERAKLAKEQAAQASDAGSAGATQEGGLNVELAKERAKLASEAGAAGRIEDAIRGLREAARLTPPDAPPGCQPRDYQVHLLEIYYFQGRIHEAAALARDIWPGGTIPRPWRGLLRFELGDFSGAAADWYRQVESTPNNWWALANLAWLLATCPDPKYRNGADAVALANPILDWLRPDTPGTPRGAGGRNFEGFLERSYALDEAFVCLILAAALTEAGDFAKARECVGWANELDTKLREHGSGLSPLWRGRLAGVTTAIEAGHPYRCLPIAPLPRPAPGRP